jgi:hypothetical protein
MNVWAFLMLVSGGLFAGGVSAVAWDRIPAWRPGMPLAEFRTDFAGVVQRADRVQPGLLVVAIVASFGFGSADPGAARILALMLQAFWRRSSDLSQSWCHSSAG